jgi:Ca2+-binding EF-hand superfamily protein
MAPKNVTKTAASFTSKPVATSGAPAPTIAYPRQLPEQQRSLYMALRDELGGVTTHPLLAVSILTTAKTVFESYVVEQWSRGVGLTCTSLVAEQVEQVFADLGIPVTPNDIRDLLFALNQSADVLFHNAKTAANAAAAMSSSFQNIPTISPRAGVTPPPEVARISIEGPPDASAETARRYSTMPRHSTAGLPPPAMTPTKSSAPSATTAAATAALKSQGEAALIVSFSLFLDMLGATLGDCNYRDEMTMLWHHLDADGDDALSAEDVKAALAELGRYNSDVGAPPAALEALQLTDERIRLLVEELDVDDDGLVSRMDFMSATNAN